MLPLLDQQAIERVYTTAMSESSEKNESPSRDVDKQRADEPIQSPFDRLLNRALTHKESAQEL